MAYEDMVQVSISLETRPISRAGFGIPLFIGAHNWFEERVRLYSSMNQVEADIPSGSDEWNAANSAFSQTPPPSIVKIGRMENDVVTLTPDAVTGIGQVFSISVRGTDAVTVDVQFVSATGSETASDIVTALSAGLSGVVGVTVGGTTTLTLTKSGSDAFAVTSIKRLTSAGTSTESAADMLATISLADDNYYFITTSKKDSAFIQEMALAVEGKTKQYFAAYDELASLGAPSEVPTDLAGILQDEGYSRTSSWFHDEATTVHPDMAYVAIGSVYEAGKVVWGHLPVNGAGGAAKNPSTGYPLSPTEKNNLVQKNVGFVHEVAGINSTYAKSGKVSNGERISIMRSKDFLEARITEAYQFHMLNKPIVPYTQSGIDEIESILRSTLNRYVSTPKSPNILRGNDPFEIRFPRESEISALTKASGIFTGEFDMYLAGSIDIIKVTGTFSFGEI